MDQWRQLYSLDLIIVNEKQIACVIVDFVVPVDHRVKLKGILKSDKYLDLARELKKTMEPENDGDTDFN